MVWSPGSVWYLIVSFPDICCLSYFLMRNPHISLLNNRKDLNCGHVRKFVTLSIILIDSLLIVTPIVGFYNCSMFCRAILCVHSSFAIISTGK